MMKLTFLLCLGFFVCVNASSIYAQDVEVTAYGITDSVNKAIHEVKQAAKQALEKAKGIAQDLKEKAINTSQRVYEKVKIILQKVNTDLGKYIAEAKKRKVDIKECIKLSEIVNSDALNIVSKASECVTQKMEQGDKYIEAVRAKSDKVLNELGGIRAEAKECLENAETVKDTIEAYKCINKVSAAASIAASKKVPTLVEEIGKLTVHLATIPASIPVCTLKSVVSDFSAEAREQIKEIKQCIRDKLDSE